MNSDDLRDFREEFGLSQRDLARLLDVTPAAVGFWETGDRPITRLTELAIEHVRARLPKPRRRPIVHTSSK